MFFFFLRGGGGGGAPCCAGVVKKQHDLKSTGNPRQNAVQNQPTVGWVGRGEGLQIYANGTECKGLEGLMVPRCELM